MSPPPLAVGAPVEWRSALEALNALHDAIVKEVVVFEADAVRPDGVLRSGERERRRARVLVQTQHAPQPAGALLFVGVESVSWDVERDTQEPGAHWHLEADALPPDVVLDPDALPLLLVGPVPDEGRAG